MDKISGKIPLQGVNMSRNYYTRNITKFRINVGIDHLYFSSSIQKSIGRGYVNSTYLDVCKWIDSMIQIYSDKILDATIGVIEIPIDIETDDPYSYIETVDFDRTMYKNKTINYTRDGIPNYVRFNTKKDRCSNSDEMVLYEKYKRLRLEYRLVNFIHKKVGLDKQLTIGDLKQKHVYEKIVRYAQKKVMALSFGSTYKRPLKQGDYSKMAFLMSYDNGEIDMSAMDSTKRASVRKRAESIRREMLIYKVSLDSDVIDEYYSNKINGKGIDPVWKHKIPELSYPFIMNKRVNGILQIRDITKPSSKLSEKPRPRNRSLDIFEK